MTFNAKETNMQDAIESIKKQHLTLSAAAIKFGIPKTTLFYRINKSPQNRRRGKKPLLSKDTEDAIAKIVHQFDEDGLALSPSQVCELAFFTMNQLIAQDSTAPFLKPPTKSWLSGFLKRYPNLKKRQKGAIENYRATAMSVPNLSGFFTLLQSTYLKFDIRSSQQVFNLEESGFSVRDALKRKQKGIFHKDSTSNVTQLKWHSNATRMTIMPVIRADGKL